MATLSEYFRNEASDFLTTLERSLQRAPGPDAAELHRAVRGLRGTAQMAREQRIFDVVSAFESVTRAIADGALAWSDNVAARARDTIADLRVLLDPTEDAEQLDARVSEAAARWREADPAPAPAPAAPVIDGGTADFREFAAREAAGIADTLDHGIQDLQTDPMDREPLTAILRRQRALLGSARLDEIPVLADILRAVEDLTRVIVKLDIGAKKEWLDIYRVARDALQTTIAPLLRDELPEGSHSVSRLRHMREELLERYGRAVAPPPPPEDSLAPPTVSHPAAPFLSSASPAPTTWPLDTARAPGSTARAPGTPPWQPATPQVPDIARPAAHTPGRDVDSTARHAHSAPAGDSPHADGDMLELGEESVVSEDAAGVAAGEAGVVTDDAVMDLDEASVIEGDAAARESGDSDGEMLELDAGSVVDQDEGLLELGEDGIVGEREELQLGDADVVDQSEDVLELGEASVAAEGGDVLELEAERAVDDDDPAAMLHRAQELHDVVARATAHDPQARGALEELLTMIRRAIG